MLRLILFKADTEFLQLSVYRHSRNPQHACCLRNIPACLFNGTNQCLFIDWVSSRPANRVQMFRRQIKLRVFRPFAPLRRLKSTNLIRQVFDLDFTIQRRNQCLFHTIFELPDISRPRVLHQYVQGILLDRCFRTSMPARPQKMFDQ